MLTTVNLVEDWIEMRVALQKQLKALEAGEMRTGAEDLDAKTSMIGARLKKIVAELTELLKEHARDSRT